MKNLMFYSGLNEFTIDRKDLLGKGATGEVYSGKRMSDQSSVAIKIIDLKTVDNQVTQYLLEMEKVAVMRVANPFVLKGIKVVQNNRNCFIVTELCNGGSLKSMIRNKGPLGEEESLRILTDLLKGMCSIIGKGIIHRDLKPANILFHNNQVKIIDFGYCEIEGYPKPSLQYNVGSPSYMSPEAFHDNQYSEQSEIWALGVTFYECLHGKTFDDGKNMAEVYKEIKRNGIPYRLNVPPKCRRIIDWCLQFDIKKRPTAIELLNFLLEEQKHRPASQSMRVSFNSIQNVQYKSKMFFKKETFMGDTEQSFKQNLSKEHVLKTISSKGKPGLSTYTQKKNLFEKRYLQKRETYNGIKTKYQKLAVGSGLAGKPPVQRHKSELFDVDKRVGFATDRLKSKDIHVEFNPARGKILTRISDNHKYRHLYNMDYYGLTSNR